MATFEQRDLTTPEHEMERWRDPVSRFIYECLQSEDPRRPVPEGVAIAFGYGRALEVYLDAPGVDRARLLMEATDQYRKAARIAFGVTDADGSPEDELLFLPRLEQVD